MNEDLLPISLRTFDTRILNFLLIYWVKTYCFNFKISSEMRMGIFTCVYFRTFLYFSCELTCALLIFLLNDLSFYLMG